MVSAYDGAVIIADILLLLIKTFYYVTVSIYRCIVPVEEKNVSGETVLITGTGHGIGRELALKYASLGSTVVCVDLNAQGNEETVNEIKKLGATRAYAYKCDVSNRDEVLQIAGRIKKEVGDVTILVNNAGIMPAHTFLEHSPSEIRKLFDVNVLAHFWMLEAFLPSMIEKNHGHVVALSSIAGLCGLPNLVPYCASKFAVRGLMEGLYEELRYGKKVTDVKFTTIFPYMVDTGLCKKPRVRFPSLLPLVTPKEAAATIVTMQRRNILEASIPSTLLAVNVACRNYPKPAQNLVIDFLDSGVETDC